MVKYRQFIGGGYMSKYYDEYEDEYYDEDEYEEFDTDDEINFYTILSFLSTWFIRIGIVIGIILLIYFLIKLKIKKFLCMMNHLMQFK